MVQEAVIIGGTTPAARDVIAGASIGMDLSGSISVDIVQGNFIGTDRHRARALYTSAAQGIRLQSSGNLIGGDTTAARNIISGSQNGILITGTARFNVVRGNFIGTDVTGTLAVSNILAGITVGGQSNTIGGLTLVPGQPPACRTNGRIIPCSPTPSAAWATQPSRGICRAPPTRFSGWSSLPATVAIPAASEKGRLALVQSA